MLLDVVESCRIGESLESGRLMAGGDGGASLDLLSDPLVSPLSMGEVVSSSDAMVMGSVCVEALGVLSAGSSSSEESNSRRGLASSSCISSFSSLRLGLGGVLGLVSEELSESDPLEVDMVG